MLKLECPFCGLADIDATSATFCSRCGRGLVGSLEDPYGWGSASHVQREAGPIDAARMEAPSARAPAVAPVTAVGFWPRMAAWGIDMAAIAIGILILANKFVFVPPGLFGFAVLWPGVFLYFTVCNKLGDSIGKAILGLKVVSVDERPIDWPRATLRSIFWLVGLASLGLGLLWIIWDEKRQGWHDKLSGTMVVKPERA
jgi:uncharacterized RDD family membrane protein YckC